MTESRRLLMLPVTGVVPAGRPVTICPARGREPVGTVLLPRSSRDDS